MKSKSPLLSLALLVALPSSIGVAVGQQAASSNLSFKVINLGTPLGGSLAAVRDHKPPGLPGRLRKPAQQRATRGSF